jgi:restriction endonuclease Mrr
MTDKLPVSAQLESALLKVLREAGGPLKSNEIDEKVALELKLTPEQMAILHSGSRTEISYRLAWVRTKAKKKGLLERLPTNKWTLTTANTEA